jgi:CubicO group peptidase (beta-lactamase class C family)
VIRILTAAAALLLFSQKAAIDQPLRTRVQAYMDEWRAAASFPGAAVGIVLKDGTAFGIATGVSDRATKRAVTTDDLFMAGSTGKTFFAAVAVELIEAGKLDLDAPVSNPLGLPDEVMRDGQFVVNPQFEWTGGGFATSPLNLARWGHELYAGKALSAAGRRRMIEAAVPARLGSETKYGLGVIVRASTPVGLTWGHSGFFPGYQTELLHVPDLGLTLAIQINTSAPRATGPRSLLRGLYDIAAMVKPNQE